MAVNKNGVINMILVTGEIAEMLYCGYYYIFNDYHTLSHYAHISNESFTPARMNPLDRQRTQSIEP